MEITTEFIEEIKRAVRVTASLADGEIKNLVSACVAEMQVAGVYIKDLQDPLGKQAITLYCKAHYGYDEKTEAFAEAFRALRDAMALSGDYKKAVEE